MTIAEFKASLDTIGYPVAYSAFKSPPTPPYIAYYQDSDNDVFADNHNYVDIGIFTVELYTNKKDLTAEGKVESLFKSLQMPYTKLEAWIEDDKLFQVSYEIQLI